MLGLERAVIAACEGKGLVLHQQPVVLISSGAAEYRELLTRLQIPDDETAAKAANPSGLYMPDAVFSRAARLGVTSLLDAAILEEAARVASSIGPVSVNVGSIAASLFQVLRLPEGVKVEISENDPSLLGGTLSYYLARLSGKEVLVDDFGEGMVRYDHLLPGISGIKLDKRLTKTLGQPGIATEALSALLYMLRDHGLSIVAEGVETEEDLVAVQHVATHAQGYFFGRPQPV